MDAHCKSSSQFRSKLVFFHRHTIRFRIHIRFVHNTYKGNTTMDIYRPTNICSSKMKINPPNAHCKHTHRNQDWDWLGLCLFHKMTRVRLSLMNSQLNSMHWKYLYYSWIVCTGNVILDLSLVYAVREVQLHSSCVNSQSCGLWGRVSGLHGFRGRLSQLKYKKNPLCSPFWSQNMTHFNNVDCWLLAKLSFSRPSSGHTNDTDCKDRNVPSFQGKLREMSPVFNSMVWSPCHMGNR